MDKLAVCQGDDTVPQPQRLAIIAQFAAHGIDVAILPAGMEMVALTGEPSCRLTTTDPIFTFNANPRSPPAVPARRNSLHACRAGAPSLGRCVSGNEAGRGTSCASR